MEPAYRRGEGQTTAPTIELKTTSSLSTILPMCHDMAGLAACEAAAEPYDLLLTDVMMPGSLSGRDLADEVIGRWPTTRIVFMSGFAEGAVTRDGRLDDGTPLLGKPFHKKDLAHVVRRALDGPARTAT